MTVQVKREAVAVSTGFTGCVRSVRAQDDRKGTSTKVLCKRAALTSGMRYFEVRHAWRFGGIRARARAATQTHLAGDPDDVDILVHCDTEIFDWLLQYIDAVPHTRELQLGGRERARAFFFLLPKSFLLTARRRPHAGAQTSPT